MHVTPDEGSQVIYVLARGTKVEYLGESYPYPGGDLWVKVRAYTDEGLLIGWINRRYIL
ncbi:MAG TPA: SH3 domain-containing protein [Blastocatellia bacterium]|nr:SH3 domain-containing protein [Blastocatellia bacterium]